MGKVGTEETLQEIKGIAGDIRMFTQVIAQGATIDSLEGFKQLVRDGKAASLLPVGTQLFDKWEKAAGTVYDAPWDIAHYDEAGIAYLNWHFCYPDGVQFDAPEAIYYKRIRKRMDHIKSHKLHADGRYGSRGSAVYRLRDE